MAVKKLDLSIAIITRPEDSDYLNRCLSTLPRGAEVIVLYNQPGTANTKPIFVTKNKNVTTYCCTYVDALPSFAHLRNLSVSLCKRSWILYLDSDEELIPRHDNFFENLNTHYPAHVGGLMCGVFGVQPPFEPAEPALRYNENQVRLFRNFHNFVFEGHCHEQIGWSIEERGYSLLDCSLLIEHNGYRTSKEHMAQKMLRNTKILAAQVLEESDPRRLRFFLNLLLRDGNNFYNITKE